jgi:hypothetical protein
LLGRGLCVHWDIIRHMSNQLAFRGASWAILASIFLAACHTPMQGRQWRMIDKRSDWQSTKVGIGLDEGETDNKVRKEFWNKAGCLQWQTRAVVMDNVDNWYVYECIDWKVTPVLGRTSERLVITDPPNKDYLGASDKARPDEIIIDHPKAGLEETRLPLDKYPVLVEWQVSATDGRTWLEASDPRIACSGSWVVSKDDDSEHDLSLCEAELVKILSVNSQSFAMSFRVSPQSWSDPQRASTPPTLRTSQARLTRDLIRTQLDQLRGPGAVRAITPSNAKKPAAGTAPASPR